MELLEFAGLVVVLVVLLGLDSHFFARGREATFRESVAWSLGWLVLGVAASGVVYALNGSDDGVSYLTVYLIERSLSLDNLFVFILLFAYFGVPHAYRARLLFWGIIAALVMRGLAILGGSALIDQFHFVLYALGVLLLVLATRIYRGVAEDVDPDKNLVVRGVRRVFPVSDGFREGHWFVREDGRRHVTPVFLCLTAIVAADLAFAVDSIPA
ncbi:MAG: tellurite resistance protein TerC, partial [bacterium]